MTGVWATEDDVSRRFFEMESWSRIVWGVQKQMEYLNESVPGMNGYEYPVVKGKDYYCVPNCIKMVLSSIGFHYSVEELASHFTIVTSCETTTDR